MRQDKRRVACLSDNEGQRKRGCPDQKRVPKTGTEGERKRERERTIKTQKEREREDSERERESQTLKLLI